MVKRYSVSLSDEDAARVDAWKEHFNLSRVFRDAVIGEIDKKESFRKRLKENTDMEAVIERLKAEKAQIENKSYERGKEDGLVWAKAASYQELKEALEFDQQLGHQIDYDYYPICNYGQLGFYFNEVFHEDEAMRPLEDEEELNPAARKWLDGWTEGVLSLWEEVQDKI